jgi:CBS domain-containing protein
MTAGRICVREVDITGEEESVQAAAQRMHSRKVGTLVVCDPSGKPTGIVTDRDLTVRVLALAHDPLTTTVGEVMTPCPATITEDTPLEDVLGVMRGGPFRRVVVVDRDERLVGLLSLDDILELLTEEFNQIGKLLQEEAPTSLAQA